MFKKAKLIIIFVISVLSVAKNFTNNVSGPINFWTEKGELWKAIKETPKNTSHVLFINGFVGTTMIDKYLNDVVRGEFGVNIIRSYMNSGLNINNEKNLIYDYNKKNEKQPVNVITVNRKSHMKSYFWFDKSNKIIRSLVGSGNFSMSALMKVKSYKEVLYDITDDPDVSRDLFCGGVQAVEQEKFIKAYKKNCEDFVKTNEDTFKSKHKIKTKNQLNTIIEGYKKYKGLIVLTGDGDTRTIKKYLDSTKDTLLDVFIGNTSAGFNVNEELQLKQNNAYNERLNIIREHPTPKKLTNIEDLISSPTAKTHTKVYVWYDDDFKIVRLLSGSANFSRNGVQNSEAFREILLELNLEKNWKDELVCKIINTFQYKSRLLKSFCNI